MIPDIFTPIRKLLSRMRGEEEQTENAYQLSEAELASIDRFVDSDSWNATLKVAEFLIHQKSERLTQMDVSDQELHFVRGYATGVRSLLMSLEFALQHEENKDRERQRLEQSDSDPRSRRLATFGSPAWKRNGS